MFGTLRGPTHCMQLRSRASVLGAQVFYKNARPPAIVLGLSKAGVQMPARQNDKPFSARTHVSLRICWHRHWAGGGTARK